MTWTLCVVTVAVSVDAPPLVAHAESSWPAAHAKLAADSGHRRPTNSTVSPAAAVAPAHVVSEMVPPSTVPGSRLMVTAARE
jgi:hypothetical protein